jgi:superfamily II DNA or RNA helicase
MKSRQINSQNRRSPRQRLLDSPVQAMTLPDGAGEKLAKMGFITVREAFRAALAGRLGTRKKGGNHLEDQVLAAGCAMLGYPRLDRGRIQTFQPTDPEITVAEALYQFCGHHPFPNQERSAASIREILLPVGQHQSLLACGLTSVGETLATPLPLLLSHGGINPVNLGDFLAQIFDYLFILHDPAPHPSKAGEGARIGPRLDHPGHQPQATDPLGVWLTEALLREGRDLLTATPPLVRLFFRQAAGAIFHENGQTFKAYLAVSAAGPTWRLHTAGCGACFPDSRYRAGTCRHLAALAISLLGDPPTRPDQAAVSSTPWTLIGRILYELFGPGHPLTGVRDPQSSRWRLDLSGPDASSLALWRPDAETISVAAALFPSLFCFPGPAPSEIAAPEEISDLWSRLLEIGRNPAQTELNDFLQISAGQGSDESPWMFLSDWLARQVGPDRLRLVGPAPDGLFSLTATDTQETELFRMTLPRAKTPDLVDALVAAGTPNLLTQAARAATHLSMGEDGTVTAIPMLRLASGLILERQPLDSHRYGRYYYLEGEGFISVIEQESAAAPGQGRTRPLSFSPEQVPKLLKDFPLAFTDADNLVDDDLCALDFQESPDRLQVDSFSEDGDWCYLSGHYGLGNRRVSLNELLSRRLGNRKFLAGGRHWLKLNDTPLEWFHNLDASRFWQDETTGESGVRLTRREMLMLSAQMPEIDIGHETRGRAVLQQLLSNDLWAAAERLPPLPGHLREYQRHGVAWLYQLYRNGLAGILADDMGLGKTHQTLALLALVQAAKKGSGRFLIVCPATVVPHWMEKIEAFFPELSHYVHHGSRRDLERAGECSICLTTYGIIRRDSEALNDLDFELIVFDEIQQLKNKKTDVHRAAARLQGRMVLGLTGTPLENSVHDLKAIFDLCLPGFLGSDRNFKTRFADPIAESSDLQPRQALTRLLTPFTLRRTRDQVLKELPEIIEDYRTCKLSDDQVALYRELISGRGRGVLAELEPQEKEGRLEYMELLAIINYLKQVCNHPCLIKKCTDVSRYRSGKWDLFTELLDECLDASMKVVVFSHYTSMLDLIEGYLDKRGISHCGLRGEMGLATRQKMIKKFNHDETCKVFTASLLTGGIGVDLTAAQAVIHYDRWWNAAREDQATARVHRMGQKHVVQVFKLITVGTLEEKIHRLITRKKDLAGQIIREDDAVILKRLSREDLLDLLNVPVD